MRRYILISVITGFILAISFLVYGTISKARGKVNIEKQIARLPLFTFPDLEGNIFSSYTITQGPLLIIRFHPECEHCRYEISEILESRIPESGVFILLISGAGRGSVTEFLDQFKITEKQNVVTLMDTTFIFEDIFGKDIVPSNYIYNEDLELVKILYGEYKMETILKYLEQDE